MGEDQASTVGELVFRKGGNTELGTKMNFKSKSRWQETQELQISSEEMAEDFAIFGKY